MVAPVMKEKRISIPLDDETLLGLHELARKEKTSIAYLGRIAIASILLEAFEGKFSLTSQYDPRFDKKTA